MLGERQPAPDAVNTLQLCQKHCIRLSRPDGTPACTGVMFSQALRQCKVARYLYVKAQVASAASFSGGGNTLFGTYFRTALGRFWRVTSPFKNAAGGAGGAAGSTWVHQDATADQRIKFELMVHPHSVWATTRCSAASCAHPMGKEWLDRWEWKPRAALCPPQATCVPAGGQAAAPGVCQGLTTQGACEAETSGSPAAPACAWTTGACELGARRRAAHFQPGDAVYAPFVLRGEFQRTKNEGQNGDQMGSPRWAKWGPAYS